MFITWKEEGRDVSPIFGSRKYSAIENSKLTGIHFSFWTTTSKLFKEGYSIRRVDKWKGEKGIPASFMVQIRRFLQMLLLLKSTPMDALSKIPVPSTKGSTGPQINFIWG